MKITGRARQLCNVCMCCCFVDGRGLGKICSWSIIRSAAERKPQRWEIFIWSAAETEPHSTLTNTSPAVSARVKSETSKDLQCNCNAQRTRCLHLQFIHILVVRFDLHGLLFSIWSVHCDWRFEFFIFLVISGVFCFLLWMSSTKNILIPCEMFFFHYIFQVIWINTKIQENQV